MLKILAFFTPLPKMIIYVRDTKRIFSANYTKQIAAISKYKDEPMHWVNGQYEAIISKAIFVRVQQILDDRKRGQIKKKFIELPCWYYEAF